MSEVPVAHALWIGSALGPIETACLRSFGAVGQRIVLHCCEPIVGVPPNVEIANAAATIPKDQVFRNRRSNSYALFSDIFRYRLLCNGAALWVDCDVYVLKPIALREYTFGNEYDGSPGTGVLGMPVDSPVLASLVSMVDRPWMWLPWVQRAPQWRARIRAKLACRMPAEYMPWGVYGPTAFAAFARQHGVIGQAQPPDVFYPVDQRRLNSLFDPGVTLEELVTKRTEALHLYNTLVNRRIKDGVPVGSTLARILGK